LRLAAVRERGDDAYSSQRREPALFLRVEATHTFMGRILAGREN